MLRNVTQHQHYFISFVEGLFPRVSEAHCGYTSVHKKIIMISTFYKTSRKEPYLISSIQLLYNYQFCVTSIMDGPETKSLFSLNLLHQFENAFSAELVSSILVYHF